MTKKRCWIKDFDIHINRSSVFRMIDCYEDSPVYGDVLELYKKLLPWVMNHITPGAALAWDDHVPEGCTENFDGIAYLLMTIGAAVENESRKKFSQGDYMAGMLLDAMADEYLFQMEDAMTQPIRQFCAELDRGILKRMEAPADIPMECQKKALEVCGVAEAWGIEMTSGWMYSPVKTCCVVFGLTKQRDVFNAQHDCSRCPAVNCKLRKERHL